MQDRTQLPATIHFPSGWRRAACLWMGGSVDEPADCRGCVHLVVKENQGDA